jgi:hypothetical protein
MKRHHCGSRHRLGLDQINNAIAIFIGRCSRTLRFTVIGEAVKVL